MEPLIMLGEIDAEPAVIAITCVIFLGLMVFAGVRSVLKDHRD